MSGEYGPSAQESKEINRQALEQLTFAQEALAERFEEVINAVGGEDMRTENLINIERQIEDINAKMRNLLDAVRK